LENVVLLLVRVVEIREMLELVGKLVPAELVQMMATKDQHKMVLPLVRD
jgi:hypothetical protein